MTDITLEDGQSIINELPGEDHTVIAVYYGAGIYPLRFWDEAFGPWWAYNESLGMRGVIRAQTFEKALECVLDEIMDDWDVDDQAEWEEENAEAIKDEEWPDLPDCVYLRNGIPINPKLHSIYCCADFNHYDLILLTTEMIKIHTLQFVVEDND